MGDKLRLQQILTILLDNAFTSCKHGSLILISANYDGKHINVSIKTEGRKVSEFEELARNHLGMEICEKVIERNNGSLEFRFKSNNDFIVKFSMEMFEIDKNFPRQYNSQFGYLGV